MSRIAQTFECLRRAGRVALMPYLTMGYPQRDSALALVPAAVAAGADLIELGVPFSDPLADGATIQAASQQALSNGMSLSLCLEQVAALRAGGAGVPLLLMSYYNPILQMGPKIFAEKAAVAGIDGAIVPDLPPEEAGPLAAVLLQQEIDPVFLLPPTADEARTRYVAGQSHGFLYLVSLAGVTGARDRLPADLEAFMARVRAVTSLPLAVGFGISTPAQAAQVAHIADGVIVGSALVRVVGTAEDPAAACGALVAALRAGMEAKTGAETNRPVVKA